MFIRVMAYPSGKSIASRHAGGCFFDITAACTGKRFPRLPSPGVVSNCRESVGRSSLGHLADRLMKRNKNTLIYQHKHDSGFQETRV